MGATVNTFCNKCGYHQLFYVGCGFNHDATYIFYGNMFRLRMMVQSPEERIRIRNIMFSHPDAEVLMSECRIYHCPYCGNLHEHYYFKINYRDEEYFPCYYCLRCETEMEPLNTNWLTMCSTEPLQLFNHKGQPIKLCCPNCGSEALMCYEGGLDWD